MLGPRGEACELPPRPGQNDHRSGGRLGFRDAATNKEKVRWRKARAEWKRELKDRKSQLAGLKGSKRARLQNEIQVLGQLLRIVDCALAGSREAMWILDQGTVREGDE